MIRDKDLPPHEQRILQYLRKSQEDAKASGLKAHANLIEQLLTGLEVLERKSLLAQRDYAIKVREMFAANPKELSFLDFLRNLRIDEDLFRFAIYMHENFPPASLPMPQEIEAETLAQAQEIFRLRELKQELTNHKLGRAALNEVEVRLKYLELEFRLKMLCYCKKEYVWPSGWRVKFGSRRGDLAIIPPQS